MFGKLKNKFILVLVFVLIIILIFVLYYIILSKGGVKKSSSFKKFYGPPEGAIPYVKGPKSPPPFIKNY